MSSKNDSQNECKIKRYVAYSVLHEEIDDGYIWITDKSVLKERTPIRIVRKKEGRSYTVFCDGLLVDKNYERRRCKRAAENAQPCQSDGQCPISIGLCDRKLRTYKEMLEVDSEQSNHSIVLSAHYRKLLGIPADELNDKTVFELEIYPLNKLNVYGKMRACFQHPQVAVRMAAWIGIVSAVVGAIGVFVGVIGFVLGCSQDDKLRYVSSAINTLSDRMGSDFRTIGENQQIILNEITKLQRKISDLENCTINNSNGMYELSKENQKTTLEELKSIFYTVCGIAGEFEGLTNPSIYYQDVFSNHPKQGRLSFAINGLSSIVDGLSSKLNDNADDLNKITKDLERIKKDLERIKSKLGIFIF